MQHNLCLPVTHVSTITCSLYYTDVAISAPFTETNGNEPGTVFIYHSTPNMLLSNEPQQVGDSMIIIQWILIIALNSEQVIRGTDLNLNQDLSGLRGFGTSLASGVDVDMNSYNGNLRL